MEERREYESTKGAAGKAAVRGTAWTIGLFYLLIVFEFFYMATPFAVYFYGAYLPGLEVLNRIPGLGRLTGFFLPHYSATSSGLVNAAMPVGGVLTTLGLLGFSIGAVQVYGRKLRRRGAAVGGIYKILRHPQYASLILAGAGMLLLWPRIVMVVFYVLMLSAYRILAGMEERECLRKFGQVYAEYLERTPRFLPFRLPLGGRWVPRSWPARLLTGILAFVATAALALGLAFASQAYTLRHLYTDVSDDAVTLSLTPLDAATSKRLVQTATADERVRIPVGEAAGRGARRVVYVLPWEWEVPEIPMNDVTDHHAPADYDRRRHRLVFTQALLRSRSEARGLDILRHAIRTVPLAEAWIDEQGRVARVSGPPEKTFYGTVPVPVF
jgi:protein-S-isoprenylcysteine O-methyltransferase Ste14